MGADKAPRWLVTGGLGFIGGRLLRALQSQGVEDIRVVDSGEVGSPSDHPGLEWKEEAGDSWGGLQWFKQDVLDREALGRAARGADFLVHLAARTGVGPSVEDPLGDAKVNIWGLLNSLEAARAAKVRRVVFASSGAPVGETDPPIHEEKAPHPKSPYGASKLAGEGYCSAYFGSYGLETVVLRFSNVYGPGSLRKESVVAKFIKKALAGESLEIFGDGGQTRDYLFVDDLVQAVLKGSSAEGAGGQVFQIATGVETSLSELSEALVSCLQKKGLDPPKIKSAPLRAGDVARNYSDISKAKRVLGWEPSTSLERGLMETLDWFLAQG